MSWAVGYDSRWQRDIGYGVPATCDRPRCGNAIDRGLSFVCGSEPYGGDRGCGLYFCDNCPRFARTDGDRTVCICSRCNKNRPPYEPTPDTAEWLEWKLSDESWGPWRDEHPEEVGALFERLHPSQLPSTPRAVPPPTASRRAQAGLAPRASRRRSPR